MPFLEQIPLSVFASYNSSGPPLGAWALAHITYVYGL